MKLYFIDLQDYTTNKVDRDETIDELYARFQETSTCTLTRINHSSFLVEDSSSDGAITTSYLYFTK